MFKNRKTGACAQTQYPGLYDTNRKIRPPAARNASGGLNLFSKRFKNPKTLNRKKGFKVSMPEAEHEDLEKPIP